MAVQLYRRKGSPCWYGKFQHRGTCHRFSTGAIKKSDAETAAQRQVNEILGKENVEVLLERLSGAIEALPKAAQDQTRRDVVQRLLRFQECKLRIVEAWGTWSASPRKGNPGPSTVTGYEAIWYRFMRWAKDHHSSAQYLHEVGGIVAEEYAAQLWGSGISPRTYNAHIRFLTSFFEVNSTRANLTTNPWRDLPRMEGQTESRRPLTSEELVKVIHAARGNIRVMILLGLYTGMRLGDVCLLQWRNVDLARGVIEFMPLKTRRKNKVVTVPIHSSLRTALEAHSHEPRSGLLFPAEADLYLRDSQGIVERIQHVFHACGIVTTEHSETARRKRAVARAGFHSLRHSFVSLCAAGGVPQVALMEMVGHGSPAMTRLYSHAGLDQKTQAIALLPSIDLAEAG